MAPGYVYAIRAVGTSLVKIGATHKQVTARLQALISQWGTLPAEHKARRERRVASRLASTLFGRRFLIRSWLRLRRPDPMPDTTQPPHRAPPLPRYEEDVFAWSQATAAAIRAGQRDGLEWEAIAEEIESLGKRDRREVASYLRTLCQVLVRWHYGAAGAWADERGGWGSLVGNARDEIDLITDDSPSLRAQLPDLLTRAYATVAHDARRWPADWATPPPEACPWTLAQVLDPDFWPEG